MFCRYFAYGSNLHPKRLAARITIVADLGHAELFGWSLRWHKRGHDGSAKCDVVRTDALRDLVMGAVYLLDAAACATLDEIEGVGRGYRVETVQLTCGPVFFYVAESSYIDPNLLPFDWYHAWVLAGARWRNFPPAYLAALDSIPTVPDADTTRATENRVALANCQTA